MGQKVHFHRVGIQSLECTGTLMTCVLNLELEVMGEGPTALRVTRTHALLSRSLMHHNLSLEVGIGKMLLVAREMEQACSWP